MTFVLKTFIITLLTLLFTWQIGLFELFFGELEDSMNPLILGAGLHFKIAHRIPGLVRHNWFVWLLLPLTIIPLSLWVYILVKFSQMIEWCFPVNKGKAKEKLVFDSRPASPSDVSSTPKRGFSWFWPFSSKKVVPSEDRSEIRMVPGPSTSPDDGFQNASLHVAPSDEGVIRATPTIEEERSKQPKVPFQEGKHSQSPRSGQPAQLQIRRTFMEGPVLSE